MKFNALAILPFLLLNLSNKVENSKLLPNPLPVNASAICSDSKIPPQELTQKQRDYAISELKRTQTFLETELKDLTDEQLNFKPAPDKWSIAEITEHIAILENLSFQVILQTLKAPADSSKNKEVKVTDEAISKLLTNRTVKVKTVEILKPKGKFPSTKAAYQAFAMQRAKTLEYVTDTKDDLLNHFWKHSTMGVVNLYQVILIASAHSERHTLQIKEVKESEGFPKN